MISHDVLIVGGGLSGLMAAAQLPGVDVAVLSKLYPQQSHSGAAQGGFNAAMSPDDSPESHLFDTVKGGDYLGDQNAIEVMCEEAPRVIRWLERLGVLWTRGADGEIDVRPLGGSSRPRACFVADMSGHAVLHTLFEQALRQGLRVYSEWHLVELLVEEGRTAGALCFDLQRGTLETIRAKAVILATGGYGQVYAKTTNALANTGDGISIAYRAGATLSDMEFVQFHPTTLKGTNILISEAARGEGGHLLDREGERFMSRYAPQMMELAPRDVVSRSIGQEIRGGRGFEGGFVHLDLRHLGPERIRERLPQVQALAAKYAQVDVVNAPLPVEPAQHYSMGGVRTTPWCETTIPGLFAAGECANVSVHGANRLGGNSLLETVVFGRRAGIRAGEYAAETQHGPLPRTSLEGAEERWGKTFAAGSQTRRAGAGSGTSSGGASSARELEEIRRQLTHTMTEKVGVFRVGEELAEAVEEIEECAESHAKLTVPEPRAPFDYHAMGYLEVGHLIELARLIAHGARWRTESRGAHSRSDHPERDDGSWLAHTFARRGADGRPELSLGEVVLGRVAPERRGY